MEFRQCTKCILIFLWLVLFAAASYSQSGFYQIKSSNGRTEYTYNEVPANLIPVSPGIGLPAQWEQSFFYVGGFQDITGANGFSLSFSSPLAQTTYFRRKTVKGGIFVIYSNTIKINVVSINHEDRNYIREHDVLIPGLMDWQSGGALPTVDALPIGDKLQSTTYLDGLGRPVQKVSRETATPDPSGSSQLWGDVVQFMKYDAFGREEKRYLPYTTTTESGKYKTGVTTEQAQYYSTRYGETSAFSSSTFDNSPLNAVTNVRRPGITGAAGTGNAMLYNLNDKLVDNVQNFTIGYSTDLPVRLEPFENNTLFKSVHTDENQKLVVEYTNQSGQIVLTKVQIDDNPSTAHQGWICTYSIYDDFGQLRCRIQPEGVKYLDAHGWSFDGTDGQKVLTDLCFFYQYDDKGRVVQKKAPGAKELKMLYDRRDRVVFVQDGNQRQQSTPQWTANLYDDLDRVIITTLYNTSKSPVDLLADINNAVTTSTVAVSSTSSGGSAANDPIITTRDPNIIRYANPLAIEFVDGFESSPLDEFVAEIDALASPPPGQTLTSTLVTYNSPITPGDLGNPSIVTILKYNFYDNYSYSSVKSFRSDFDNGLAYSTGDPIVKSLRTTNKVTGTKLRILGTSTFLATSIYYDDKGRAIQTVEDNIKSSEDVTTNQYQFDGRLLSSHTKHSASNTGYSGFGVITKNIFDKIGRVTGIEKKYGGNAFKTIATYDFDDIGRLKTKHLDPGYTGSGKNELESLDYSYNIHSEFTGINKDYALKTPGKYDKWGNFFGMYLGFDNRDNVFAAGQQDGHVTGTLWSTQGDDAQRKYDYTYDYAGRLTSALFTEKEKPNDSWNNNKMDVSVTGNNAGKIAYDLNGNLLSMIQKGVIAGYSSPVVIDNLQYAYASLSNKLLRVTDNATIGTANGKSGDFADGSNTGTDDYVYDDNGNVVIDLNKNAKELAGVAGANGIRYNYLDKPEEIHITGKGTIKMVYDAAGNKLQKLYTPEGSSLTKITSYINEFIYEGDVLQYINFEEGRICVTQPVTQNNGYDLLTIDGNMDLPGGKRGSYDFFIRDYQSNVRMILTEETHLGSNSCTMETSRAANEEPLFGQVDASGTPTSNNEVAARFATSSIPGQGSGGGWQNSSIGNHVSRIGNLASSKIGPNTLLKVMAGDQVSATTIYYYQAPVVNHSNDPSVLTNLLVSLTQALTGSGVTSGLMKSAASSLTGPLSSSVPFSMLSDPDQGSATGDKPKAYLSVAFFDERFNFIAEGSTSLRVSQDGSGAAPLVLANIKAPKNGYAYVYISNVSDQMVYFDNLQVANNRGRIIEENHYYAYGLKIASISSHKLPDANEGHVENKDLYNDKELIDEADLNWYDYGFRNYDPQIGRFPQLDPLTDRYPELTPYQYASNDPILNIDLDGLEGVSGVKLLPEFVVVAKQAASHAGQLTARTLTLSAIKLAATVVKGQIAIKTLTDGLRTKSVQDNLNLATSTFYELNQNKMTYGQYLELGVAVDTYFKGLNTMAWWAKDDFISLERAVISNETGNVSEENRILITEGRITEATNNVITSLKMHADIPLALGYAGLDPIAGTGPKGSGLKFRTLPPIPRQANLEGALKSNYNRFVKNIPVNSKSSATYSRLKEGNYLFEATSPGKVPGSSALYQKWVNSEGETFRFLKTTFAPDGSIVHIKSKF